MLGFLCFVTLCALIRFCWESERFNNVYKQLPGSIGLPMIGNGLLLLQNSSGKLRILMWSCEFSFEEKKWKCDIW
jgi:hypothetical protein